MAQLEQSATSENIQTSADMQHQPEEEKTPVFQGQKQKVSASELLQALADGMDIQLSQCEITGVLDLNRLFDEQEKFQTESLQIIQKESRKEGPDRGVYASLQHASSQGMRRHH